MCDRPTRLLDWRPDEPLTVVCAARYFADLLPAWVFMFRVCRTDTRFTIYADLADAYLIDQEYHLALRPVVSLRRVERGADAAGTGDVGAGS
jgi:hypothetical protein